jgi:hypothetical protein
MRQSTTRCASIRCAAKGFSGRKRRKNDWSRAGPLAISIADGGRFRRTARAAVAILHLRMLVACSDSRPRKAVNRCQTQGAPLLRERCAKFAQRRFKLRRVDAEIAKPIQQLVAAHHPLAIQHLANCTADNSNDIAAPVGVPWMWTLAFGHHEDRTPTHGYAATREAAMTAFAEKLAAEITGRRR